MNIGLAIASRLRLARAALGIAEIEAADACGISIETLRRLSAMLSDQSLR
jgi:transcriptional regulator with XRE-family HTH domain